MNIAKTVEMKYQRYYNGILLDYTDWTVFRSVTEVEEHIRNSVDSGNFIPGSFRINAYQIGRTALTGREGRAEYIYNSGLFKYIYKFRGYISLLVNEYTMRQMMPTEATYGYLRKLALQKAYSKVGQANLQLGVELGELRETFEMLRNPFKDLRSFLSQENFNSFARALRLAKTNGYAAYAGKTLASTWLEIRYGLRPLLSSIVDISREVSKKAAVFDANIIRTAKSSVVTEHKQKKSEDCGGAPLVLTANLSSDFTITGRAGVYYKLAQEPGFARKYGLSLADIPEIMWELTRLSFVVDWVLSIGPWLGSYRIIPGLVVLGATTSLKWSGTVGVTYNHHRTYDNRDWQVEDYGASIYDSDVYNRTLDTALPSTPLFRFGQAKNLLRTLDALALSLQPSLNKLSKLR